MSNTQAQPQYVTVFGPGEPAAWLACGRVLMMAPYSVKVSWEGPSGADAGWFVWEPGRANHLRQHGVAADHAIRIGLPG